MLVVRGLIFTLLVPCMVGLIVPWSVIEHGPLLGGIWSLGWVLIIAGASIYLVCLSRFLAAGGTPMIYFARPLKALVGEEPSRVVSDGLYRVSRNPMYVGVFTTVVGQAIVFRSLDVALYAAILALCFHLVVVFIEEPHLRAARGPSYDDYCRRVPRWIGWPKPASLPPAK
jgi:protein-S-isoprenylcysteine O-methyltransferase Ste14